MRADFTLLHAEVGQEMRFGLVAVTVSFSQLLSFLLHLLFLGNQFYSILGLLNSLACLHGRRVQSFLDNLYISHRKRQSESSCLLSYCLQNYVSLHSTVCMLYS